MYVKFDPNKKFTTKKLEDQEISDNLDDFEDAGYILSDNEIVVDIDGLPAETIEAMLKAFNIKTKTVWTDRGAHLYFLKPKGFRRARGVTALGFEAEYKHTGNTYAITIKRNGVARRVENEGTLKQLPNYLQPHGKQSLVGLDEGDGRNNALYAHKKAIYKLGNTQKILTFINEHILAKPLDNNELQTLARDENFEAEKDGEAYIAEQFMKDRKVVKHQGVLYFMNNGRYTFDVDELNRAVYEYCYHKNSRYVDEIVKQMLYKCETIPDDKEFKIKLKNGFLYKGDFFPYNYTGFTPYYININYNPDAEPVQKIDDYLELLSNGDEDYKKFILEIMATCLIVNREFKRHLAKFFIFVGDGGNGKGTLLEIITRILNTDNIGACSITELGDSRYLHTLIGKLANLGDDLIDEPINRKEMKVLKNLSTGDRIQARALYQNPVAISITPTLIFTSNHILKSFDKDYSYKRRVMWCPIYNKPKNPRPDFISSVTTDEALEYWLKLIVEAYQRLYSNGNYTESQTIKEFNEQYHRNNNNTLQYIETLTDDEINGTWVVELQNDYEAWCKSNGEEPQSNKQLSLTIEARGFEKSPFRRKSINDGKTYKGWRKKKFDHLKRIK